MRELKTVLQYAFTINPKKKKIKKNNDVPCSFANNRFFSIFHVIISNLNWDWQSFSIGYDILTSRWVAIGIRTTRKINQQQCNCKYFQLVYHFSIIFSLVCWKKKKLVVLSFCLHHKQINLKRIKKKEIVFTMCVAVQQINLNIVLVLREDIQRKMEKLIEFPATHKLTHHTCSTIKSNFLRDTNTHTHRGTYK